MRTVSLAGISAYLLLAPAHAAETIEAIGAEKCGGGQSAYAVDFLAPDDASLEARAKARVGSRDSPYQELQTLSLDGRPCPEGRCSFQAKKGQTYKIVAEPQGPRGNEVCVSVGRP